MKNRGSFKRDLLASLSAFSVSTLMITGGGFAQDADTEEEEKKTGLEEIIVTGTKRAMSIQDVGQSISAFGTDAIERQSLQNMEDYVKSLPSMSLYATQPGRNQIVFRGISSGTDEFRTDSSVSVYLDEQPMTAISQQVDPRMVDIERIESLPGPQGTLFGSSSQSGTLRIITNKPDPTEFSGKIELAGSTIKGGEKSYDINGWLNVPLVEDKLALRVAAFSFQEGGYIDNVLGEGLANSTTNAGVVEENFNDWGGEGGRAQIQWNVNDKWTVLATGLYEKSKSSGDWKSDPSVGDFEIVRFHDDYRNDEWWSAALTIKGDLGFAELVSATSYLSRDISYEWDGMTYDHWRSTYHAYYSLYNTGASNSTTFNEQSQKRFAQEVRLTSQGESRFQWMVGGFYEKIEDEWFWGTKTPNYTDTQSFAYANYWSCYYAAYYDGINCPLEATDVYYGQEYDRTVSQKAVFGEMSYDVTDKFKVVGGIRWFEFDRERTEQNQWPWGLPPFQLVGLETLGIDETGGKQSDTVYKLGAQYVFDDKRMWYFNYSQGFRVGGTNSFRASAAGFVNREYDPDKLTNYETGFKTQWFDDKFTLNVSYFHMIWNDIQTSVWNPDVWWMNGNVNAGKAVSKGFEASAWLQVTDRLTLNGSLFTSSAKYTEDVFYNGEIQKEAGERLSFSPKLKYWLAAEYTIPDVMWGASLWFRYDFWYQADMIQSTFDNFTIPAWNTSDFQVGFWKDADWDVTLSVNNLWDQKVIYSVDRGDNYISEFFGTERYSDLINYSRPREITLTYRKRF